MKNSIVYLNKGYIFDPTNKQIEIMTRIQTLENRLEKLQAVRENYTGSTKIGGIIKRNQKSSKYVMLCMKISKEIRILNN